jgi:hypothetical protein
MKSRKPNAGQQQSLTEVSDEAPSPPLPFDPAEMSKLTGEDPTSPHDNSTKPDPVEQGKAEPDPAEQEKAKFSLSDYEYQNTLSSGAVRQRLIVPEGKPGPDSFFRIDPRPEMQKTVAILVFKPDADSSGDIYPVSGALIALAQRDLTQPDNAKLIKRIRPAKLKVCVRIEQNESETGYDVEASITQWPDPAWPTETLDELAEKAYPGRFITSFGHEIWKRICGEE